MDYLVNPLITDAWWTKLCLDESRMITWLKKLYATELDGYYGNIDANVAYNKQGGDYNHAADAILRNTAGDELRHANMIKELLAARGHTDLSPQSTSVFWDQMDEEVFDLKSYAAMSYFGERLAAERFEIIAQHKFTPSDVLEFISSALPDESYHKNSFRRLAGEEAIERIRPHFQLTLDKIVYKK